MELGRPLGISLTPLENVRGKSRSMGTLVKERFCGKRPTAAPAKASPTTGKSTGWSKFLKKTLGLGLLGSALGYGYYQESIHGLISRPQVQSVSSSSGMDAPLEVRVQKEFYPTVPGLGLYNPAMVRAQLEFTLKILPINGSWTAAERTTLTEALKHRGGAIYQELLNDSVQPLVETYLGTRPALKTPSEGAVKMLLEEDFLVGRTARMTLKDIPCRVVLSGIHTVIVPSPFALPESP